MVIVASLTTMKSFAVLLSALAIASALDVDWNTLRPRHIDPEILDTLPDITPTGRITGGQEASAQQFPYQVGLFLEVEGGTAFCGGSLIDPEWVLTAGHCVDGVSAATVVLGAHNIRDSNEPGRVEISVPKANLILHEKYDGTTIKNDIALIKIPAVQLSDKIQTINLPKKSEASANFEGRAAVASGWGRPSDAQSTISDVLRFIDTAVMKLSSCKLKMLFLPQDTNICIDGKNGKSTCNGDSGGPLAVIESDGSKTVVGATSFGLSFGCEKGYPAAFTRVTSYLDWIVSNTGINLRN